MRRIAEARPAADSVPANPIAWISMGVGPFVVAEPDASGRDVAPAHCQRKPLIQKGNGKMHNSRSFYAADGIVVARGPLTGPRPIAAVLSACSRMLLQVRRELAIARAARELEGFNDYQLKDIGLTRDDIPRAVRHGRAGL
jgi:uncharacterized protein YjiS (DUF1127 family)